MWAIFQKTWCSSSVKQNIITLHYIKHYYFFRIFFLYQNWGGGAKLIPELWCQLVAFFEEPKWYKGWAAIAVKTNWSATMKHQDVPRIWESIFVFGFSCDHVYLLYLPSPFDTLLVIAQIGASLVEFEDSGSLPTFGSSWLRLKPIFTFFPTVLWRTMSLLLCAFFLFLRSHFNLRKCWRSCRGWGPLRKKMHPNAQVLKSPKYK